LLNKQEMAKRLAAWSIIEDDKHLDELLAGFVAENTEKVKKLKNIDAELARLKSERLDIISQIVKSQIFCSEKLDSEVEKEADDRVAEYLFWHLLEKASKAMFNYLQPQWDDIESELVKKQLGKINSHSLSKQLMESLRNSK